MVCSYSSMPWFQDRFNPTAVEWGHGWEIMSQINGPYNNVVIGAMASQITSLTVVYSTVYLGDDQRKHQAPRHGEFPAQMASNAGNVSIWWRHHGGCFLSMFESQVNWVLVKEFQIHKLVNRHIAIGISRHRQKPYMYVYICVCVCVCAMVSFVLTVLLNYWVRFNMRQK